MKRLFHHLSKYKHGIPVLLYMAFYFVWFAYLEKNVTKSYHLIHMKVDDLIPFQEIFVIPYFLWFGYVAIVMGYCFLKDKSGFYRNCVFLFTGMTVFLVVSTLFPNGHNLRPYILPNENFLSQMVNSLYHVDTATNIFPSIHVYNSLGAHFAVMHCARLRERKAIRYGSLFLCVSIILSTMLIKQHSVFDVITAFIMAGVMYISVYQEEWLLKGRILQKIANIPENN